MVAVAQESSGSASSRPETNHLHQAQVVGFLICIVVFCPAPRRVDVKESSKRGLWIPHAVLHGASPIRIIAVRLHVLIRARPSLVRFGVAILAEIHPEVWRTHQYKSGWHALASNCRIAQIGGAAIFSVDPADPSSSSSTAETTILKERNIE